MNRRDFLKQCALWTALAPFASSLVGCAHTHRPGKYTDLDVNFQGSVLVIGAGAAGLAAGYLLSRYNIPYEVLEASPRIGGRCKRHDDLADFPIDLGAEWIHDDPSILAGLIDDPTVEGSIEVIPYSPESFSSWRGGKLRSQNWARNFYQEYKFKNTTWFGFLENYIAPDVLPNIRFNQPVVTIDTTGERAVVITEDGSVFEADRVVVTVPIKVLQDGLITFLPEWSSEREDALNSIDVPHGIKVFCRFKERFYPDIVINGRLLDDTSTDKLYYDAAFRKEASTYVLGLFWVSDAAAALTELGSDDAILAATLADLDNIFDGAASNHFIEGVVQNWSAEPWIRGAYSVAFDGDQDNIVRTIADPTDRQLLFAGEAFGGEDSSTVHGAMWSAYDAIAGLLADG